LRVAMAQNADPNDDPETIIGDIEYAMQREPRLIAIIDGDPEFLA